VVIKNMMNIDYLLYRIAKVRSGQA